MVALLVGCAMPGPYGVRDPEPVEVLPPAIASFAVDCDVDDGQWTVEVEATAWTGGGTSWWTVDGVYVEEHGIDPVATEPDGAGETLEATISVVVDWRLASARNTAFACSDDPNVLFELKDLDGNGVDCRVVGPDPAIWAGVEGVPGCSG